MASYQHAGPASQFASAAERQLHQAAFRGGAMQAARELSFPGNPAQPQAIEMPGWEFELDEEFDIVEQISAPDWSDVAVDHLSCSRLGDETAQMGLWPDPHEFDLPLRLGVVAPALAHSRFVAAQYPPSPAPVFRAYRPPSLIA